MKKKIELRDYQKECVELVDGIESGNHVIVLATGLGKTVCFANFKRPGRMLILSHRDELVRQPEKYFDCPFGVEKAEEQATDEEVVSASVQSMSRDNRLLRYAPDAFHTIVVDECHHTAATTYRKILNHFSGARRIIGVTATPKRTDNVRLDDVFEDIIFHRDLRWGIEHGYLSRVQCQVVRAPFTLNNVTKIAGDFSADQMGKAMTEQTFAVAAKAYIDFCHNAGRHTIIYCINKKICFIMQQLLKKLLPENEGETIQVVTGGTPAEERKDILDGFNEGRYRCVINCMVLTEGTDLPRCDTIFNMRPTCSTSLYQQIVGRGTRLFPGKDHCLVIDLIPDDDSGNQKSLCVAPTLFGVDYDSLSKQKKKEMEKDDFDLMSFCEEISGTVMETAKRMKLTLDSVNRFVTTTEQMMATARETKGNTLKNMISQMDQMQTSLLENDENIPENCNIAIELTPDENRRYLIKPTWDEEIYISAPDILGNVTFDARLGKGRFIGQMKTDKAFSLARDICECSDVYKKYMWDKKEQDFWKKIPGTERQQYKISKDYDVRPEVAKNLNKLESSRLIDLTSKLAEQKAFLKTYEILPKMRKATKEKKENELRALLARMDEEEEKAKDKEQFEQMVHNYKIMADRKRESDRVAREQEAEKNKDVKERMIKEGIGVKTNTYIGNPSATDRQISFMKDLIPQMEAKGYVFEKKQNVSKLLKSEAGLYIDLMLKLIKNYPKTKERLSVTEESLKEAKKEIAQIKDYREITCRIKFCEI